MILKKCLNYSYVGLFYRIKMDCPVCMECIPLCTLLCGHQFCKGCIREWYFTTSDCTPTCPMCRKNLCFKGMMNAIPKWTSIRDEKIAQDIFADVFDEVIDNMTDNEDCPPKWRGFIMIEQLIELEKRFQLINEGGFDLDNIYDEDVYFDNIPQCNLYEQVPKRRMKFTNPAYSSLRWCRRM